MTESLYAGQCLRLLRLDEGFVELQFDRQNEALNKLDGVLIAELRQAVALLANEPTLSGVLVRSAKDAFLAGAELAVLWSMFDWPSKQLVAFCEEMDQTLTALEDLPVPVVCAINGFALGGGLEVALCSDYRVMALSAQIGFPEVGPGHPAGSRRLCENAAPDPARDRARLALQRTQPQGGRRAEGRHGRRVERPRRAARTRAGRAGPLGSSDAAVATTVAYALAMDKTPLVVKDCPGFLINRILGAYFSAFQLLIRDGADYQQIDRVMESYGWPMGPAYLLDVAGIDTLDKAMKILGVAYPAVMSAQENNGYTTIIQRLAGEKRYGQKTGAGFYRYEADAKGRPRRSGDSAVASLIASVQAHGAKPFEDEEILDRMMLAMMLEAARCLDEQVVGTAIEVDAGMRLGTGFPAHHVGPLWAAQTLGLDEVLRRCDGYATLGGVYVASTGLRGRAHAAEAYYSPTFT